MKTERHFEDNGTKWSMTTYFNPIKTKTLVGCGLAVAGVLIATLDGWKSGVCDAVDSLWTLKEEK